MATAAVGSRRRLFRVNFLTAVIGGLVGATSVAAGGVLLPSVSPASATEFSLGLQAGPTLQAPPVGRIGISDVCGYAIVDGQEWAHLGNDSQGYKSGPVKSIGTGVVKRVINDPAPDSGLMVEYQSSTGPFTLSYQHVTPGVTVGSSVVAGQQIGTVANWPKTRATITSTFLR